MSDLDGAQAFYEKMLDVKLEPMPSDQVELRVFPMEREAAGSAGALVKMEGKGAGAGGTLIYFTCEDCAVEAERAAKNGGKICKEKFSIGEYGYIALVTDTEGNMIGLHSIC